MSDDEPRDNPFAAALGYDSAYLRRRVMQIRQWAASRNYSFVEDMLEAQPRLRWALPETRRAPLPEDYETAFGFTRVEAEIAVAFVAGSKLDEIAAARGISINTVRTHFAHLKDKLGKRTQTEVQRELMKV